MPTTPQSVLPARTTAWTRAVVLLLGVVLTVGLGVTVPPSAHAAMTARERFAAKADRVLDVTRNQRGDPYRYGAAGPNAFDCSGLVYYVFRKALGRTLPRVANDQKHATKRIWHRRNLRRGDLVFEVTRRGYAYHVGIYAGHGYMWHAPHSGSHVKRQKMWPSRWRFGRIIRT